MDTDYVFELDQPKELPLSTTLVKAAKIEDLEKSTNEISDFFGIIRPEGFPRAGEVSGWGLPEWTEFLTRVGFGPQEDSKHQFLFTHLRVPGWRIGFSTSPGDHRAWMNSTTQARRQLRQSLLEIRRNIRMVANKSMSFLETFEQMINAPGVARDSETWNDAVSSCMAGFMYVDRLSEVASHFGLEELSFSPRDMLVAAVTQEPMPSHGLPSWHRTEVDKFVKQLNKEFGLGLEAAVSELGYAHKEIETLILNALKDKAPALPNEYDTYLRFREVLDLRRAEAKAKKKSKRLKSRPVSKDTLPADPTPSPPSSPAEETTVPTDEPAAATGIQNPDPEDDYIALTEVADLFERPFETVRGWCRRHEIAIYNIAESDGYLLAVEDKDFTRLEEIHQQATRRKVNRVRPHHKKRSAVTKVDIIDTKDSEDSKSPKPSETVMMLHIPKEAEAVCTLLGKDVRDVVQEIVRKRFSEMVEKARKALE